MSFNIKFTELKRIITIRLKDQDQADAFLITSCLATLTKYQAAYCACGLGLILYEHPKSWN
jgi:hypothetical protein